jgi:putative Mn2+ efflux pump MntP
MIEKTSTFSLIFSGILFLFFSAGVYGAGYLSVFDPSLWLGWILVVGLAFIGGKLIYEARKRFNKNDVDKSN